MVRAELERSARTLHLRAVLNEERRELITKHTTPDDKGEDTLATGPYEHDIVALALETPTMTPAQVALAWLLAQGDDIVPIPGTKRLRWSSFIT